MAIFTTRAYEAMQLDKYQASILTFLFSKLPIDQEVDSLEFALSGTFEGKYCVVHAEAQHTEPPSRVVLTLPRYSNSVFLALTLTRTMETARLLANLEDYERSSSLRLVPGDTVVTPDDVPDREEMPYAVILLRTETSLDCEEVPDREMIDGKNTSFNLVVPLTKAEWEVRRKNGQDALMDKFESDNKQLFF